MSRSLAPWLERAQPAADILNPALGAVCVAWCATRYERDTKGEPLPFPLAFLVAPLVLHAPTRAQFPSTAATHFPTWVTRNAEVLVGFPTRSAAFVPYVREGLRAGVRSGLLTATTDGDLTGNIAAHTTLPSGTELRDIATAAALTGAWFARAGTIANVYTQLGVTP